MRFRFTLIDYTFDPDNPTTTVLPDEPVGWDALEITIKRDPNTHGIFFEYSVNKLSFHGDGYAVIDAAYQDSGVEAYTNLLIEVACSDTDPFEELYMGRLVYPRIKYSQSEMCLVEIPIEQTSCVMKWRNRMENKVNLLATETLDGTAPVTYDGIDKEIKLPAKPIFYVDEGHVEEGYSQEEITFGVVSSIAGDSFTAPRFEIDKEDFDALLGFPVPIRSAFSSVAFPDMDTNEDLGTFQIGTVESPCDVSDLRIDFSLDVDWINPETSNSFAELKACILRTNVNGGFISSDEFNPVTIDFNEESGTYTASGSVTMSPNTGDRIWVGLRMSYISGDSSMGGAPGIRFTVNSWSVIAYYETQCDSSTAKLSLVNEVLSRTAEIISDDCIRVYSDYFGRTDGEPYPANADGCGGLEAICNGLKIRRATKTDGTGADVFVSMKGLFDSLNAIHNIGMGFEPDIYGYGRGDMQVLRIEPVKFFYKSNVLMTCTNPKELQRTLDIKRLFAIVNIGYKQWESEFSGGLDEFLSKREYRTEITQVDTKLDKLSDLIASGYAIEVTRREGRTTEDSKYDNDLFIICLERFYGDSFAVEIFEDLVTGNLLSGENLYNVRISPVRNLMRWYKSLRTVSSSRFKFNSGDANYIAQLQKTDNDDCLLETQVDSLHEDNDISVNNFKNTDDRTPIWLPEILEFSYPLSFTEFKLLQADPTATITVTQGSNSYNGFIDEINYNPSEGEAKFKLLKAWT